MIKTNTMLNQFVIFKPLLSYCFEETIGFDVKASFTSRPVSHLISWYSNQVIQQNNFDKRLFSSTGLVMDWESNWNSGFYKIFMRIYFRREIKRDIAHTSFHVLFKKVILTPWPVSVGKIWLKNSLIVLHKLINLEHTKHNRSLY